MVNYPECGGAARAHRRARAGGADDGGDPARRRRLHRDHEGHGHADGDGARRGRRHVAGAGRGTFRSMLGVLSMPLSLLFDPDSFYLGALPVVAEVAGAFGVPPIQVGQAALLGQMTTGFPVSPLTPATFLLVGLSGIELAEHQRFTAPWLFAASLLMTAACIAVRSVPAVKTSIRIGCGAGYSGDRIEPAVELADAGRARLPGLRVPGRAHHRARAAAQGARSARPATIRCSSSACAPCCRPAPSAASRSSPTWAPPTRWRPPRSSATSRASIGLRGLRVAAVTGDDVLDAGRGAATTSSTRPGGRSPRSATRSSRPTPTSAPSRSSTALAQGARRRRHRPRRRLRRCSSRRRRTRSAGPRTTGRCSGARPLVGHLLECAGQVTGGYFADPGCKDVAGLARLGFPDRRSAEDGARASSPRSPARAAR